MLRLGSKASPQVVLIPSLFHEGERTRAFAAALMRALARRHIGTVLVELAGLGESEANLPDSLEPWAQAVENAREAVDASHTIAIRAGALLDGVVSPNRRYRIAPIGGAAIVRDLRRTATMGQRDQTPDEPPALVRLAGYPIPSTLLASLGEQHPAEEAGRVARLAGDARPADVRMEGPLLWRQAEPDDPNALADAVADDLAGWLDR